MNYNRLATKHPVDIDKNREPAIGISDRIMVAGNFKHVVPN
jgi:hypothetical protein